MQLPGKQNKGGACVYSDRSASATPWWWSVNVCVAVRTLNWLRPSSSEAEASPSARPGPTVGNGLCVIVRAINC